jgi:hypothetical protein
VGGEEGEELSFGGDALGGGRVSWRNLTFEEISFQRLEECRMGIVGDINLHCP